MESYEPPSEEEEYIQYVNYVLSYHRGLLYPMLPTRNIIITLEPECTLFSTANAMNMHNSPAHGLWALNPQNIANASPRESVGRRTKDWGIREEERCAYEREEQKSTRFLTNKLALGAKRKDQERQVRCGEVHGEADEKRQDIAANSKEKRVDGQRVWNMKTVVNAIERLFVEEAYPIIMKSQGSSPVGGSSGRRRRETQEERETGRDSAEETDQERKIERRRDPRRKDSRCTG